MATKAKKDNIDNKGIEYVDLGLPSGRLWPKTMTVDKNSYKSDWNYICCEPEEKDTTEVASYDDWKELFDNTEREWDFEQKRLIFKNRSQKYISLPILGYKISYKIIGAGKYDRPFVFCYWCTVKGASETYFIYISEFKDELKKISSYRYDSMYMPVLRLPKIKQETKESEKK